MKPRKLTQLCHSLLGAVHRIFKHTKTFDHAAAHTHERARAHAHGAGSVETFLDPALNFQTSTRYCALGLRPEIALDYQPKHRIARADLEGVPGAHRGKPLLISGCRRGFN
jgi:hypothetical protein